MTTQLLYLAASLAGVAAIVGFCILLFGHAVAKIDADAAEARLRDDVPGFRKGAIALSPDSHAALVEDARDGALYLVIAQGAGLVTRKLSAGYVRDTARKGAALDLRLADFTFPKARLFFAEEESARAWEARLSHAS